MLETYSLNLYWLLKPWYAQMPCTHTHLPLCSSFIYLGKQTRKSQIATIGEKPAKVNGFQTAQIHKPKFISKFWLDWKFIHLNTLYSTIRTQHFYITISKFMDNWIGIYILQNLTYGPFYLPVGTVWSLEAHIIVDVPFLR